MICMLAPLPTQLDINTTPTGGSYLYRPLQTVMKLGGGMQQDERTAFNQARAQDPGQTQPA